MAGGKNSVLVDRRLIAYFDWGLLVFTLAIPCLGLVVLYSAGYDADSPGFGSGWLPFVVKSQACVRQLIMLGIGSIALVIGFVFPPQTFQRYAIFYYLVCVVMLVIVDIKGVASHNATRWLSLGGLTIQPSEPMKIGVILMMARYLSRVSPKPGGFGFLELGVPFLLLGLPLVLVFEQPDLGTALVIGFVGFAMILCVGIKPKVLLILGITVATSLYPFWHMLKPYQRMRIEVLLWPELDVKGSGYHINQSKIAVGSGQVFGKGFLKGTQAHLDFLPEHTTDFIFSVLAEEWGFFGACTVLLLYLSLIYRVLMVMMRSKDSFSGLFTFGVAALLFFHTFVNMGMVLGVLPVVGIPLPLFSYGGSAVVSIMFALGIVMGISMRRVIFAGL